MKEESYAGKKVRARANYGARYEPEDQVLHGAGQSHEAYEEYARSLRGEGLAPAMYMAYTGLGGAAQALPRIFQRVVSVPEQPILQLGLSMTSDGQPEKHYEHKVAAGEYDEALDRLADDLASAPVPVLLRIGYECNGPWNGYEPETYQRAFRRVVEKLREKEARAAAVWCIEGGFIPQSYAYYPGDDVVDWWSIDLFAVDHLAKAPHFLERAAEHKKPVLIGESTPRRVGVEGGEESWKKWFGPYFDLIRRHPGIKGFSYINWNWASYPQWSDWGNARIQDNACVADRYRTELQNPIYKHGIQLDPLLA